MRGDDRQPPTRLLHDLCSLLLGALLLPRSAAAPPPAPPQARVTMAGVASLLLGASLALMLCGSVTFVVGIFLMPWIFSLVAIAYIIGVVSSLSGFGRPIPSSVSKNMPGSLFSNLPII